MPRTVESQVYKFEELESAAQERARDWFRQGIESDDLSDYEDWETIAEILGVEFKTTPVRLMGGGVRREPCIHWSGFSSQGDGASFEGWYRYAKGAATRIREHAPMDKTLHRIADDLQSVQRQHFYQLEAKATRGHLSNFYSHSGTMAVGVSDIRDQYRDISDAEDIITQALRDFADWIYSQLEAQNDYLNSEETVDETIKSNGYEFTAEGSPA